MKRTLLMLCLLSCFCGRALAADEEKKIYIDPKVAQSIIEQHFSHMTSKYLEPVNNLNDADLLINTVDAYNKMLKQNDGFASVPGLYEVCRTAFNRWPARYAKGDTVAARKETFRNKCLEFVTDLLSVQERNVSEISSGCPYEVSKVGGSQTKIQYKLPNNSGFIRSGGSIAWRFFNPGNLRGSDLQCTTLRTKPNGNFAVFPNAEAGKQALHDLLSNNPGYRNLTVKNAIYKYAPPSQNNTSRYINNLRNAGINVDATLSSLTDAQMRQLEDAIMTIEGWNMSGTETRF